LIRLYRVTKRFPSGRVALRDVSFHVAPGEFVLLTGPTGAGKSTLLRILFGEERPTSGSGVVNGRNLERLDQASLAALRRELGLVFQDPRLIDRLSVLDNVALAAEIAGQGRAAALRRALHLNEKIGLAEYRHAPPTVLSAGQRQKVALARALVNRPVLLLADEPTGNLDPDATAEIIALLEEICRDGTTVLIATHDQDALDLLRCRTLILHEGRLIEEGEAAPADL